MPGFEGGGLNQCKVGFIEMVGAIALDDRHARI